MGTLLLLVIAWAFVIAAAYSLCEIGFALIELVSRQAERARLGRARLGVAAQRLVGECALLSVLVYLLVR